MWKLIFIGVVVWLLIYFVKRVSSQNHTHQSGVGAAQDDSVENMVQCAHCNVHLPRSEAFLVNDRFYCCRAHIPSK